MIQTMQSELFRIRKSRLFWACLVLAAFFVFALALTFYHNSVNGMLPVISLVSFTEFLFSDYSLIFPLTLFLCLYFTEDFHTGTYSITLSKGTSRVHLFFGKLLASWGGVLFFLFVCFGVAYLSILMMGASRYDIKYSFWFAVLSGIQKQNLHQLDYLRVFKEEALSIESYCQRRYRHLFCGCLIYRIWPIGGDTQWSWQVDRRYFPVPQAGNRVWN